MADLELTVSPGFLLLAAALYYFGGGGALTAFLSAALAHELGHITAMLLCGASVRGVRVTAGGPVLLYSGLLSARQEMIILLAGPGAGLLFALFCLALGTPFFLYAGAIALLTTAFNLMPVLPMDGGRLAKYALDAVIPESSALILRVLGSLCGLGVALTGAAIASPAAAAVGIWMAVLANVPKLR